MADEALVAELWRLIYRLPAWYDPRQTWWPLSDAEATALAQPTVRVLEQASPRVLAAVAKFAAPVALVATVVAITAPRLEQTRYYARELRIAREVEARRAALGAIRLEEPPANSDRPDAGGDGPLADTAAGASGNPGRSGAAADLFG